MPSHLLHEHSGSLHYNWLLHHVLLLLHHHVLGLLRGWTSLHHHHLGLLLLIHVGVGHHHGLRTLSVHGLEHGLLRVVHLHGLWLLSGHEHRVPIHVDRCLGSAHDEILWLHSLELHLLLLLVGVWHLLRLWLLLLGHGC